MTKNEDPQFLTVQEEMSTLDLPPQGHEFQCRDPVSQLDEGDDISMSFETLCLGKGCCEWLWGKEERKSPHNWAGPLHGPSPILQQEEQQKQKLHVVPEQLLGLPLLADEKEALVSVSTDLESM